MNRAIRGPLVRAARRDMLALLVVEPTLATTEPTGPTTAMFLGAPRSIGLLGPLGHLGAIGPLGLLVDAQLVLATQVLRTARLPREVTESRVFLVGCAPAVGHPRCRLRRRLHRARYPQCRCMRRITEPMRRRGYRGITRKILRAQLVFKKMHRLLMPWEVYTPMRTSHPWSARP